MTPHTYTGKIGVAALIMMTSVFLSRVIGVFREMAIAMIGGVSSDVDAYQVAFILPDILNHVVASGFLSITFIPIFTRYLSQEKEVQGWEVFSNILNTFGLCLVMAIGLGMIFAPRLIHLFAPGITDPETIVLAVRMTRIILPAQFFFFCGGLLMAVQFSKGKFFIPAMAPLIYNAGIILGGMGLNRFVGMEGFAWGVLAGAFAGNFAVQLIGAGKAGLTYRLSFNFRHPDFIRYVLITLPFMLGLTMTFSSELMFKFFGSLLDQGSIAILGYNFRIMFVLIALFGQAVGTASYPFMADLVSRHRIDELNQLMNRTISFIFLVIPFSVLFCLLRFEIVFVLFTRGAFDLASTRSTSAVLPFIMIGAFAYAMQTIVPRGYYAMQNTWFPTVISTVSVLACLPVYYLLTVFFETKGLALGMSIGAIFQTFVLFELWNRKSRNRTKKTVYLFLCKVVLISILTGAALTGPVSWLQSVFRQDSLAGALAIGGVTVILFISVLSFLGYLFRIRELSTLYGNLAGRVKKRIIPKNNK